MEEYCCIPFAMPCRYAAVKEVREVGEVSEGIEVKNRKEKSAGGARGDIMKKGLHV
jgi:hypothetical protein